MASIETSKDGPYLVKDLPSLENSRNEAIDVKQVMALCRCGASKNKPFCDGAHSQAGFKGDKHPERVPDKQDTYEGKDLIIRDNRGVCAHAGFCTTQAPKVFRMKEEPWINPDNQDTETTTRVIKLCPSGALSYTKGQEIWNGETREPKIIVSKDGPLWVQGSPAFKDEQTDSKPESKEHYTLCRCGASKNKPFCDGSHWSAGFKDEKN